MLGPHTVTVCPLWATIDLDWPYHLLLPYFQKLCGLYAAFFLFCSVMQQVVTSLPAMLWFRFMATLASHMLSFL